MGKRQLFMMGYEMNRRYIQEKKLLSPKYNPKEVYVRSTDVNRTVESAIS